jgi:hypothetical protein
METAGGQPRPVGFVNTGILIHHRQEHMHEKVTKEAEHLGSNKENSANDRNTLHPFVCRPTPTPTLSIIQARNQPRHRHHRRHHHHQKDLATILGSVESIGGFWIGSILFGQNDFCCD